MDSQKSVFLSGEGDKFYNRYLELMNSKENGETEDEVLSAISQFKMNPRIALEVGCANGWRLNQIQKKYSTECYGFDPSQKAILSGNQKYESICLSEGTADDLQSYGSRSYDLIIFGYCLYLCDRIDLFAIAANVDRSLAANGFIILWDFYSKIPYENKYSHKEGVNSYKMAYTEMFTWNPCYTKVFSKINHLDPNNPNPDEFVEISVIWKNENFAYVKDLYKDTPGT
jgi:hypothetical protein